MRDEMNDRIHYVRQLLQKAYPKGISYKQLALGIEEITRDRRPSLRTIMRDIERLERQGFDIHASLRGRERVYSLSPDGTSQAIPISDVQLLALSLAQEMLEPLRGTIFWNGMQTFWHETLRTAPETTQQHFRRRRQRVVVRGKPAKSYAEKGGVLSTLLEAQLAHREVVLSYQKPGASPESRTIRPYAVAFHEGSIYIVAEDADRQAFRIFKLDRIAKATRTDRFFAPSVEFDPQTYFANSLSVFVGENEERVKHVRVRLLSPSAVSLLTETPLAPDQEISTDSNGHSILTIPAAYEDELVRNLLFYQDAVEILAPASCRRRMRDVLARLQMLYQ